MADKQTLEQFFRDVPLQADVTPAAAGTRLARFRNQAGVAYPGANGNVCGTLLMANAAIYVAMPISKDGKRATNPN